MPDNPQTKFWREAVAFELKVMRRLSGLKAQKTREVKKLFEEIRLIIRSIDPTEPVRVRFQLDRVEKIAKEIRDLTGKFLAEQIKTTNAESKILFDATLENSAASLAFALGLDGVKFPHQRAIDDAKKSFQFLGDRTEGWFRKWKPGFVENVRRELVRGLDAKENLDQLIKRVAPFLTTARNHMVTHVRTALSAARERGRDAVFRANDDVVSGKVWIATLDTLTSEICISLHGKKWTLDNKPIGHDKSFSFPAHPNERSITGPDFKHLEDIPDHIRKKLPESTQASILGQLPKQAKFDDFFDKLPIAKQRELLPLGKIKLYREGKITLSDLTNSTGRQRTYQELVQLFG